MARFLGVSHTWVNKLVKKFEADPERMRRKMAAFAPASIDKLERAREETRWEREHGRLREPIRYRRVKIVIQGKRQTVVAATRVERRRRQAEIDEQRAWLRGETPERIEMQRDSASRAGRALRSSGQASSAPTKATASAVAYRDVPEWAKGLPGLGGLGIVAGRAPQGRTPRPVPFAFRRRR